MKVIFKVIKAGSGNDVYFERLAESLKKINIDSEIHYFSKKFQYFPFLIRFFNKPIPCDIIHSNAEYGWAFKEKNKKLYISLLHNVFDRTYSENISFFQKIYYKLILRPNIKRSIKYSDKIIAISNYTKESFIEDYKIKNLEVIYCTINSEKYKPLSISNKDKKFKLLFVGNLIKRKGSDLLPQIMSKLGNNYVLFYTAGLRSKIPSNFNLPNMIPLGRLTEDQLVKEYAKSDALLFPTRLEGFGYAVLEAMACGKPIISTNTSSIPELVTEGKNGFLCGVNDVECFVNCIKMLSNDRNLQRKFGNKNRERVLSDFNEKMLRKTYI